MVDDIQVKIAELQNKGWTLAAIADEVGVTVNAVEKWKARERKPSNPKAVFALLDQLLTHKRIPPKRRYQQNIESMPEFRLSNHNFNLEGGSMELVSVILVGYLIKKGLATLNIIDETGKKKSLTCRRGIYGRRELDSYINHRVDIEFDFGDQERPKLLRIGLPAPEISI